jgi:DNA helicase IV
VDESVTGSAFLWTGVRCLPLTAVPHPELPAEQAYVDNAYACLDRMREIVARASDAAVGEVAALALEAWSARRLRTFEDADRGLCFGRLTLEDFGSPLYVGRRWVHDDDDNVLVINWQAPAARPFYTASPADPHRVTVRRRYRTQGRRLLDLSDERLDGTGTGAALGDFLLEELERSRDQHMRDIVATIQGDQYRLITREPEGVLVIQGGPGTGKTAVGLHRASYLLYTHRDRLSRAGVLVVGPNPTFMEYVSHVLPALGEDAVEQRAVGELVDGVAPSREDPPDLARLKGDARMAEVIRRAAELRQQPAPEDLYARLEGALVTVRAREVQELLDAAREELGSSARSRERFRMNVLRRFYEHYGRILGGGAIRDFAEVERALRSKGFLGRWLDRVWPLPAADTLVRTLLTQRARLVEAAEDVLSSDEQALLLCSKPPRGEWGTGDLPLLDEARALLAGTSPSYGHVIVDEAQDLTPMQLRMIARRAPSGSVTVLGDIAQATGPVEYRRWADLLPYLPLGDQATVEELRYAYRVPREIMELALPLLERIAPDVEAPVAYRAGVRGPVFRRAQHETLLAAAMEEASRLSEQEGLLAVIAPADLVEAAEGLPAASAFDDGIPLLTPRGAKGLEFDHVIVVEPAAIAEEDQGLRGLYVALTRPTKTLVVVHARPLPPPLDTPRFDG